MAIRIPSRKRQDKYGYVQRGEGSAGGPLDVACPTLISPTNGSFVFEEDVTFSWGNVSGATSYNFYLWEQGDEEPQPINTTSLTYSTTLTFGSTYRWRVNTVNDFGESSGCTYGLVFPSLPDGKSGYVEFEVTQGFVELEDNLYIVNDSEASVTINVIRTGSSGAATVDYATADGTAVTPTNYTDTSGTATWGNAESGAYPVEVPIEPLTLVEELAADYLPDWGENSADPRVDGRTYDYRYGETVYSTREDAVAAAETALGYSIGALPLWRKRRSGESPSEPSPLESIDPGEDEFLNFQYVDAVSAGYLNTSLMYSEADWTAAGGAASPEPFVGIAGLGIPLNTYFYLNIYGGIIGYLNSMGDAATQPRPTTGVRGWGAGNNCIEPSCPLNPASVGGNPGIAQLLLRGTTDIGVRRLTAAPPLDGEEFPDWEHCPENYTYDAATDTIYSKAQWGQVSGNYRWLSKYSVTGGGLSTVQRRPLGPVLEVGDPSDTQAFWTAAYEAAVAAGDLPSGMTYDSTGASSNLNRYPKNATYAHYRSYKLPKKFTFSLSNASGATIRDPDTATVWIVADC